MQHVPNNLERCERTDTMPHILGHKSLSSVILGIDPGEASRGPRPPWVQIFFNYYIFYFCSWAPLPKSQTLLLFDKSNQPNSNSNYPTEKFNKNNKNIHNNGDCISAKKVILPPMIQKNYVLLEKLKLNFLQFQ